MDYKAKLEYNNALFDGIIEYVRQSLAGQKRRDRKPGRDGDIRALIRVLSELEHIKGHMEE